MAGMPAFRECGAATSAQIECLPSVQAALAVAGPVQNGQPPSLPTLMFEYWKRRP
jgi:hypothetical protein